MTQFQSPSEKCDKPVAYNIDKADTVIEDEMSKVNWHAVTETEAVRVGKSLGSRRDKIALYEKGQCNLSLKINVVLSVVSVIVVVMSTTIDAFTALIALALYHICVTFTAWWKVKGLHGDVNEAQNDMLELVRELAVTHKLNGK